MPTPYYNNGFWSYWKDLRRRALLRNEGRLSPFLSHFQTGLKLTGQIVKDAGIELLFLLLFWYIITKMGQGRDLIVSLFEPGGIYDWRRVVYTLLSVVSFSVSMWVVPAFLFEHRDRRHAGNRFYRSIFREHLFFAHRVLPLVPFWLLAYVLFNGKGMVLLFTILSFLQLALLYGYNEWALSKQRCTRCVTAVGILLLASLVYFSLIYQKLYLEAKIALAVILYLLSTLLYFGYHRMDHYIVNRHQDRVVSPSSSFRLYWVNSALYIAVVVIHIIIVYYLFTASRLIHIAPESMLLYLFSLYVFLIDLLVYLMAISARRKFVFFLLVVSLLAAYLYTKWLDLNTSHYALDDIGSESVLKGRERLSFEDRYKDMEARIVSHTGPGPYPIVLVSGEGGGSRAGMWFSQNLINFDLNTQGRFRDHIFSLSTVSGSSVGLSTVFAFWDETGHHPAVDPKWSHLPSKVYANNYVGSSVSGLLLTDLWKLLTPFGKWEKDRNSVLQEEEAYYTQKALFEVREGRSLRDSESLHREEWVLAREFMSFFYEEDSGRLTFRKDRPLVLINACRSNDGRRGIISPMKLESDVFNDALDVAGYLYEDSVCDFQGKRLCSTLKKNISLGQACNTSELFPLFSAPVYIESLGSFVDGGYHENSGLKTTLDMYGLLRERLARNAALKGRYRFYILYLKNGSAEKDLYKPLPSKPPLLLPLTALFNQPFEGSASYFEERARHINRQDTLVQYIEVKLDNKLIVMDSTITGDSVVEGQILSDLFAARDTTKKDTALNFPLARWLSRSVIHRMRYNAELSRSKNDSLKQLLRLINATPLPKRMPRAPSPLGSTVKI